MPQKKRTPKRSQGIHGGGGKAYLTEAQKAQLGKGIFDRFAPIGSVDHTRAAK